MRPRNVGMAVLEPPAAPAAWRWLALGASTGGPAALRDLLAELPSPLPLRVVVAQHIAPGAEEELAAWLGGELGLDVRVARDGERPEPGSVRLGPADVDLRVTAEERLTLGRAAGAPRAPRAPIDALFHSLAAAAPRATVAALLTGMGADGAAGLLALRRAGALCLAQDEASSAVFGLARAALRRGAAELSLAPGALGRELARRLAASTAPA